MNEAFEHAFVDTVPAVLQAGVIYVSLLYATAVHLCACGCGAEVVTPLSPTDWQVAYDGGTLSLLGGDDAVSRAGSIGNWSFPCRSHYVIRRGYVHWCKPWTAEAVVAGRAADGRAKRKQFTAMRATVSPERRRRRAAWSRWLPTPIQGRGRRRGRSWDP